MRVKEILPWTIESPVIQLVQPSPAVPQGPALPGLMDRPVVPLPRVNRSFRQGRQRELKKKNSNLNCDYISPSIHQLSEHKISKSFYDLRNKRTASVDVREPVEKACAAYIARSKSLDESSSLERRKTSPNFEDILRDLCCDLKRTDTSSECSVGTSPCEGSAVTKDSSSDSVFYDVALDDFSAESSNETQPDVNPRKSFSEDTFDRHRKHLAKQRERLVEKATSKSRTTSSDSCDEAYEEIWKKLNPQERRRVSKMVDDLLLEIYRDKGTRPVRRRSCMGILRPAMDSPEKRLSPTSGEDNPYYTENTSGSDTLRYSSLQNKSVADLRETRRLLQSEVRHLGGRLVRQLCRRDGLLVRRDYHCDWITAYLQANSEKRSEDTKTRFSVAPSPSHGDSGFTQWQNGMRMVARLPEGIPPQFRKTLWLNLAEKHLTSRGIQWQEVEEFCFNEFTNPDDEELGIQIVKDVHRTGCSLFCGVSGKDNQALLKRVLLAYARWNKAVGYCQGFNMLAALILQVMDREEVDAVKVMIYLIEGVLPESYFANNLRGLSVDMAVFRDLLRIKLPTLSRHFDQLQIDSKDSGTSYEPPLTNVFTMQWFLTLFCNCLPQTTVLRVWDLIFLEGNHVLLATALAIWNTLADRILSVESADEFYCIMGVLTREMLEFGLMDANALIKAIVSFNLSELPELRERYLYNITPWTHSVSNVARRGLRLFYSDDDTDTEEDDDKIAIATAYGLFKSPKKKGSDSTNEVTSPPRALICPDREKIAMDISALTKQYRKLRERQKQAHVILTAACGSQSLVTPTSPAMNHLLMGKFALINNKGRRLGPPPGAIPPPSASKPTPIVKPTTSSGDTLHWKDAAKRANEKSSDDENSPVMSPEKSCSRRSSSSSSTSTELCDDPQRMSDSEDQSNSLSECYTLPDVSGCSPLKSFQGKTPHSLDVESCREEPSEPAITVNTVPSNNLSPHNTDGKEDSITPEEDDKPQKRKPSFKIDPEEMRQLDRKLSLKIVEIERRKSSAGIESEDLNSVLFSFDRDYIQEGEKSDRDSPSSIPDDRLCSTDEFVCGLEESVTIPDLITTHKPLNYRMTSLEECDEPNDNENLFDADTQGDWEDCVYNKFSIDNEECAENNEDMNINEINYDHLFALSTEYSNGKCNIANGNLELETDQNFEQANSVWVCQAESQFTDKITSEPSTSGNICSLSNHMKFAEFDGSTAIHFTSSEHSVADSDSTENNEREAPSSYKNINSSLILSNENINFEQLQSLENKNVPINILQKPNNDSKTNLDKKLANLLPSISASDSSPPNFAHIHSADGRIKSIKEKYANFPQSSIDMKDAAIVLDETNKFLSKLDLCYKINELNFLSSDNKDILVENNSLSNLPAEKPDEKNIEQNSPQLPDSNDRSNSINVSTGVNSEDGNHQLESMDKCSGGGEKDTDKYHCKSVTIQPDMVKQKESPKRRGSEVALSLILKENSQILSKIHQQSRRSSEICIESKTFPEAPIGILTESLLVIDESDKDHSKPDIVDTNNLTSENTKTNEHRKYGEQMTNSPESSMIKYNSKDLHIGPLVVEKNNQSNKLDEVKAEIGTRCKNEESYDISISEMINSFDISCRLPDLCKLDGNNISSSRETQHDNSTASLPDLDTNLLQKYSEAKEEHEIHVTTCTTEPLYYKKEEFLSSALKEENTNFSNYLKSAFEEKGNIDHTMHSRKPTIHGQPHSLSNKSTLYNIVDEKDIEIANINFPKTKEAGSNEDILDELRSLDIEPDEVLDYFDPVITKHSTSISKESIHKKRFEEMSDLLDISENNKPINKQSQYGVYSYSSNALFKEMYDERYLEESVSSKTRSSNVFPKKQMSFDYSSNFDSTPKSKFNAQKSYSVDTILPVKYEGDPNIFRAKWSDSEHDRILNTDCYNYRERITEDSTLNTNITQKSSKDFVSQFKPNSSLENYDESDYSLKKNKSPLENISSLRQSRFSEHIDSENRVKMLLKYKSEDFGGSISQTHYRFSSASPIRKGLTSPSPESSICSSLITDRAKSSSPISGTFCNKKNIPDASSNSTVQEYDCGRLRDGNKYFRTESLDLNPKKEDCTKLLKKKAESFETFSTDNVLKEKKSPTSPLKFNPFPVRSYSRQPRDLGVKLGLYLPAKTDKSPTKHVT